MEKIIKIALEMGFDPTQTIIAYKVLDTIQMLIAFFCIGIAVRWIMKKINENQ